MTSRFFSLSVLPARPCLGPEPVAFGSPHRRFAMTPHRLIPEDVHRAGVEDGLRRRGVVPGGMGSRRRKVYRISDVEDRALALDLHRQRVFDNEEDLFPFVGDRLAAMAGR